MGAPASSSPLPVGDGVVCSGPTFYRGVTVRETAGASAVLRLFDAAAGATGVLLETVALAADESFTVLYPGSIRAAHGIYADVTGAVEGSLRIG